VACLDRVVRGFRAPFGRFWGPLRLKDWMERSCVATLSCTGACWRPLLLSHCYLSIIMNAPWLYRRYTSLAEMKVDARILLRIPPLATASLGDKADAARNRKIRELRLADWRCSFLSTNPGGRQRLRGGSRLRLSMTMR
jgi:hypothetical protein